MIEADIKKFINDKTPSQSDFMALNQLMVSLNNRTILATVPTTLAVDWVFRTGQNLGAELCDVFNITSTELAACKTSADIVASVAAVGAVLGNASLLALVKSTEYLSGLLRQLLSGSGLAAFAATSEGMTLIAGNSFLLNAVVKNPNAATFTSSEFAMSLFTTVLATCADSTYFARYPVVATTTYTSENLYYHNLTTNTWGTTRTNQNAIYCVKSMRVVGVSTYPATLYAVDNSGTQTALISSVAVTTAQPINRFAIGSLGGYHLYTANAWTAGTNDYGEAFLAI